MAFGNHLKEVREERGISQLQLATWLGYSPQYICDIEHSRRPTPDSFLEDLISTLDLNPTLTYLWAGKLPPRLRFLGDESSKALADLLDQFDGFGIQKVETTEEAEEPKPDHSLEAKKSLIEEAKKDGCKLCGDHDHIHFHHIRPEDKLFQISDGLYQNYPRLKAELEKCAPLCRTCHMKVHRGLIAPQLLDKTRTKVQDYVETDPYALAVGKIHYEK